MRNIKKELRGLSALELAGVIARTAREKKGGDIVVLDVAALTGYTDYFVIVSGRSTRQVQGLARAIDDAVGSRRLSAAKAEGLEEGHWVLLDYNDVVVHVFYEETRRLYDLEGLWHDAGRVDPAELGMREERESAL
jgi:ribosome-associated protein